MHYPVFRWYFHFTTIATAKNVELILIYLERVVPYAIVIFVMVNLQNQMFNQLETKPGGASGISTGAVTRFTVISKLWGRDGVEEGHLSD